MSETCRGHLWEKIIVKLFASSWYIFLTYVYDARSHLHQTVFMCFVWISKQTAIISLYNINWLVFITETEYVYCAVRTGSLNILSVHFSLCKSDTTLGAPLRSHNYSNQAQIPTRIASLKKMSLDLTGRIKKFRTEVHINKQLFSKVTPCKITLHC